MALKAVYSEARLGKLVVVADETGCAESLYMIVVS